MNISKEDLITQLVQFGVDLHTDKRFLRSEVTHLIGKYLLDQPDLKVEPALTKDALVDIICEHTALTYHCTRVWQAWSAGTMTQDDFYEVNESALPSELADAILAKLYTQPPVPRKITAEDITPAMHQEWSKIFVTDDMSFATPKDGEVMVAAINAVNAHLMEKL